MKYELQNIGDIIRINHKLREYVVKYGSSGMEKFFNKNLVVDISDSFYTPPNSVISCVKIRDPYNSESYWYIPYDCICKRKVKLERILKYEM